MATGQRTVSDALTIMRLAISRRNPNDPDSTDAILLSYLNDFISLSMSDDIRMVEQMGALTFNIDGTNTTGVYTFNDVGADEQFVSISNEALISLLDPIGSSVSWNQLSIYTDPGEFFYIWGINNESILIPGYPTMVLFYGNQFTFRTIPQATVTYMVKIYGYKKVNNFSSTGNPELPYDYWLRYIAYGAALNYARDFRYDDQKKASIEADFYKERKLRALHTHNQIKNNRAFPRF